MASLEYLQECMARDLEIMDDKTKSFTVRHAARTRFWHCEKRVGAMIRGGTTHDEPGHFLIGYSEEGLYRRKGSASEPSKPTVDPKYASQVMDAWDRMERSERREHLDQKHEVEVAARNRL